METITAFNRDGAEARDRECWATLARLKNLEESEGEDLFQITLDFQPTLARALYDLSETYRKLHQEKRSVVARKAHRRSGSSTGLLR